MAEKSFFQRIFCSGVINRFDTGEYNEEANEMLENLAKSISSDSAKELIENSQRSYTQNIQTEKGEITVTKTITNRVFDNDLGVVFNADIMSNNDDSKSFEFGKDGGIDKNLGLTGSDEINTHKAVELYQSPVVSGLIFDDKDDSDDKGFVVKNNEEDVVGNVIEDEVANNLISMLSNSAVDTKPKYEPPSVKSKVVDSEVDLPMI